FFRRLLARSRARRKSRGMKMEGKFYFASLLFVLLAFISVSAFGQKEERRERTIDEIRVEAIRRAEVGQYPLIGLDPGDVKEAFENIHTADKDEWAAGFMHVADRYFHEAKSLEKTDPTKANADTSGPGAFIRSGVGRSPPLRANNARMRELSRRFWRMRVLWIRRSRSCAFLSKEKKLSATCVCRRMQ